MIKKVLSVVAGIITNNKGQVLIAKRPPGKPHPGLWEFPGGKRELGESAVQTLRRELCEEVAINVLSAQPLVARYYDYLEYAVDLQAWTVDFFTGLPSPCEGQVLKWVDVVSLGNYSMPEANGFVVDSLLLKKEMIGLSRQS